MSVNDAPTARGTNNRCTVGEPRIRPKHGVCSECAVSNTTPKEEEPPPSPHCGQENQQGTRQTSVRRTQSRAKPKSVMSRHQRADHKQEARPYEKGVQGMTKRVRQEQHRARQRDKDWMPPPLAVMMRSTSKDCIARKSRQRRAFPHLHQIAHKERWSIRPKTAQLVCWQGVSGRPMTAQRDGQSNIAQPKTWRD